MKRLFERVTRDLVRRGIREGLLGGNGVWLALGAVAWLARWLARTPPPRVVRERIRLGETIVVTCVPPPPFGRKARKLARAERRQARSARRQAGAEGRRSAEGTGGGPGGRPPRRRAAPVT